LASGESMIDGEFTYLPIWRACSWHVESVLPHGALLAWYLPWSCLSDCQSVRCSFHSSQASIIPECVQSHR